MFFKLSLLFFFVSALCVPHSDAQDSPQWGLPKGAKTRLGKGIIREIQYSPDGTRLAVASSIGIWLYDTATHQEIALLTGHTHEVRSVAFSPDGNTIASGSDDNTIRLWNVHGRKHQQTLKGHTAPVVSVAFSPDGRTLASGSRDGTVLLWELNPSTAFGVRPLGSGITTLGNIKRTALLQNYPNPFNPETWIPYHLANDAVVTLSIYEQSGHIVRTLDIGRQVSGVYRDKASAAYWDGFNHIGEPVTSGTYYYQLRAGDYTALRRMVIVK